MKIRSVIGSLLGLALMTGSLHAHFIWAVIEKSESGDPQAQLYFSETATPDSAKFLDRLTRLQAWHRTPDGKYTPLELSKIERDDGGLLGSSLASGQGSIEAECLYGTFSHSDQTMLLHYYAKSLNSDASDELRRSRKLDSGRLAAAGRTGNCNVNVFLEGQARGGLASHGDASGRETGGAHDRRRRDDPSQVTGTRPLRDPGPMDREGSRLVRGGEVRRSQALFGSHLRYVFLRSARLSGNFRRGNDREVPGSPTFPGESRVSVRR